MFLVHKWHKESEPWERLPAGNGLELHVGTALAFSAGNLVKATGTTKPEYICMENVTTTAAGQLVHVERVRPETEYETELSVANTSIKVGTKYTIATDGETITATSTDGVAEVMGYDGTAAGDKVRVRFS